MQMVFKRYAYMFPSGPRLWSIKTIQGSWGFNCEAQVQRLEQRAKPGEGLTVQRQGLVLLCSSHATPSPLFYLCVVILCQTRLLKYGSSAAEAALP